MENTEDLIERFNSVKAKHRQVGNLSNRVNLNFVNYFFDCRTIYLVPPKADLPNFIIFIFLKQFDLPFTVFVLGYWAISGLIATRPYILFT